ncbi:MAG: hypothetical protein ABI623_06705 [bacterium]
MSLKAFHIVFIVVSILLALGCGLFELNNYTVSGEIVHLLLATASFLAAAGLVVYAVRFMRKLKHVSMI